jgi:Ca2+-binding RTX toxin-like protein
MVGIVAACLALPATASAGSPPVSVTIEANTVKIDVSYPAAFHAPVSILPNGPGTADDEIFVSAYGFGWSPSCTNFFGAASYEDNTTRCPLGTLTTITGTYYGDGASNSISLDLDRPGLPMTTTFTLAGDPAAGFHLIDGSPTQRGVFDITARNAKGGGDDDTLTGTTAADDLDGGPGEDELNGLAAGDTLKGGSGDDTFLAGSSGTIGSFVTDSIDGGDGSGDTLSLADAAGPSSVSLNDTDDGDRGWARFHALQLRGIENVSGTPQRDILTGNGGANRLMGLAGNDLIDGGGGSGDVLRGGPDDDDLRARSMPAAFSDVGCGGGNDVVTVDALDVVSGDCENSDRSAPDPVGTTPGDQPGTTTEVVTVVEGADRSAPTVTLGKLPSTVKRSALLKGLTVTVTPNESAAFQSSLVGQAKKVTVSKVGEITLAEAKLGMGTGARKLKLKPSRRLLGRAKKLTLLVTATDAAGNRRELRKALKITK